MHITLRTIATSWGTEPKLSLPIHSYVWALSMFGILAFLEFCQLRLKIPHCTGRKVRHPRAVKVYSFNRLDENGTGW
jgi:hypothetical protein